MRKFGDESFCKGVSFHGPSSPEDIERLILLVIKAIGMTPIFESKVYTWTEDNIGFISIQPLYESCVVVDYWPCHNGGYMYVVSCKDFDSEDVAKALHDNGYEPVVGKRLHLYL